jgi:hypothetical protein
MVPTKLVIGEILITFAIMVPGVRAAAQRAAVLLGCWPRPGPACIAEAHGAACGQAAPVIELIAAILWTFPENDSVFDRICTARSTAR